VLLLFAVPLCGRLRDFFSLVVREKSPAKRLLTLTWRFIFSNGRFGQNRATAGAWYCIGGRTSQGTHPCHKANPMGRPCFATLPCVATGLRLPWCQWGLRFRFQTCGRSLLFLPRRLHRLELNRGEVYTVASQRPWIRSTSGECRMAARLTSAA